jgi:hypothetical protein
MQNSADTCVALLAAVVAVPELLLQALKDMAKDRTPLRSKRDRDVFFISINVHHNQTKARSLRGLALITEELEFSSLTTLFIVCGVFTLR